MKRLFSLYLIGKQGQTKVHNSVSNTKLVKSENGRAFLSSGRHTICMSLFTGVVLARRNQLRLTHALACRKHCIKTRDWADLKSNDRFSLSVDMGASLMPECRVKAQPSTNAAKSCWSIPPHYTLGTGKNPAAPLIHPPLVSFTPNSAFFRRFEEKLEPRSEAFKSCNVP